MTMKEASFTCARCSRTTGRLDRAPVPGPTGAEIQARVCGACWSEWERMEVMVINELRLNFMDPRAAGILNEHMRQFLMIEEPDASG